MIFLTTPSIVLSTLDKLANKYRSIDPLRTVTKQIQFPVFLTSVMPVLLLRIFAAAMPSLVSVTSLLEKQWKKSALDKSMMIKLFVFLSMMILILPSLGLTSIESFLRWVFESEDQNTKNNRIRWMCVFLPDNGAFFVNYIITSAFIGAAIELLRLADLVFYIYIILTAKSTAERRVIRHVKRFFRRFVLKIFVFEFHLGASISLSFRRSIRVDIGCFLRYFSLFDCLSSDYADW